MRSRTGITFVEVLVVVGIIAVIAAIALPALFRSRQAAREADCVANLRQLWLASETYRQDWDSGGSTAAQMGYPPADQWYIWMSTKYGILKTKCPALPWGMFVSGYLVLAQGNDYLYGGTPTFDFGKYYAQEGTRAVVVADPYHNPVEAGQGTTTFTISVKSILVDGSYRLKHGKGTYFACPSDFWKTN